MQSKLKSFSWEGLNKQGKKISGETKAYNKTVLLAELQRQEIAPTKVKKKSDPLFSTEKKIKVFDIVLFTRHLATLVCAGLPLSKSLEIIATGQDKKNMRLLILEINNDINGGMLFSDALLKHTKYFNNLYISLIRCAEQTGKLDIMLQRIADYLEKTESLKNKIKKALTYPIAIILITLLIANILLIFIVPQFAAIFKTYGSELPAFTRTVLSLATLVQKRWWLLLVTNLLLIYGFILARKRFPSFNIFIDTIILKIPVFGKLLQKAIIARTMRTLSTNLAAGVPLIDSMSTVSQIANNSVYQKAMREICESIKTGEALHKSFAKSKLFPHMVVQMIGVGEESGALESMLDKIATFYEEDVDNMVSNLSSLIEPLIMVFIGVIIGGFVLAMYLPIFKLGSLF